MGERGDGDTLRALCPLVLKSLLEQKVQLLDKKQDPVKGAASLVPSRELFQVERQCLLCGERSGHHHSAYLMANESWTGCCCLSGFWKLCSLVCQWGDHNRAPKLQIALHKGLYAAIAPFLLPGILCPYVCCASFLRALKKYFVQWNCLAES